MMRRLPSLRSRFGRLLTFATSLWLGGCASTGLVNMWKDSEYREGPMTNVLVVAMKRDALQRRAWEDELAEALSTHHVKATPSYRLFAQDPPDTQQVAEAVHANRYDGVMVTRKLPTEEQARYVPGYTTTRPVTVRNPWTGW